MDLLITNIPDGYQLKVEFIEINLDCLATAVKIFKEIETAEEHVSQKLADLRKEVFEHLHTTPKDEALKLTALIIRKVAGRL